MHPKCEIAINGAPVAGRFWERLISVTVNDKEGAGADTIDLYLEDGAPHLTIPQHDDLITCSLGYAETGVSFMGSYKVSDVTVHCLPWTIKVQGKSADMRKSLKEHRERHWDKKTIKDIVGDVAGEAGLEAQVDGQIGSFRYDWWGQQSESGMHMLHRLADRHNGLFTVKHGKLIFAKKGSGQTAGGTSMPPLILMPQQIVRGTCEVHFAGRPKHKSIKAEHYDRKQGKRLTETVPGEDRTEATYTLRHAHAGPEEAKAHAKSRSKKLKRDGTTTSVEIEGDPTAKAGRPIVYRGVRPGVNGIAFIIESAAHTFSRAGYRTKITGKLKV